MSIRDISVPQFNSENEFLRVDEEPEEGEVDETLKGNKKPGIKLTQNKPEAKKKTTRMLCLNLSDGKNVVKAIEYQPIHSLKTDIPIGSKILIKGPVDVSFKVLLLKPDNIQVISPPSPGFKPTISKSSQKPSIDSLEKMESPESKPFVKPFQVSPCFSNGNIKGDPDRSIVDLTDTIVDDQMIFDDLDDEILE